MSPAQLSALTGGSITTDDTPVSSAEESPGCAAVVVLSAEAVAQHASANDCWVIVGDGVYDMTAFLDLHPGGQAVLAGAGGTDATALFMSLHDPEILEEVTVEQSLRLLFFFCPTAPQIHLFSVDMWQKAEFKIQWAAAEDRPFIVVFRSRRRTVWALWASRSPSGQHAQHTQPPTQQRPSSRPSCW